MHVGYLLHYVRQHKLTGIERYGLATARALAAAEARDMQLSILASRTAASELGSLEAAVTRLPGDWRLAAEQLIVPAWARIRGLNGMHVTAFGGPWLPTVPFVLTVFDSVFWDQPASLSALGRMYYRPLVERALRSSLLRGLVFISESARADVLPHLPRQDVPNTVAYATSGMEPSKHFDRTVPRRDDPIRILSIGTIEPRKNLAGMAAAVRVLRESSARRIEWTHVGRRGWLGDAERSVLGSGDVIEAGMLDGPATRTLLQSATLLLSLSHLEGFNLPIAEALGVGTPVIASRLPVHAEVGGPGAILVSGNDPVEAAKAMQLLADDEAVWLQHADSGWHHARQFSAATAATRLLALYRRVF